MKIPTELTLEARWKHFAKITIPDIETESVQYLEMKKAFFSGMVDSYMTLKALAQNTTQRETVWIVMENIREYQDFVQSLIKAPTNS